MRSILLGAGILLISCVSLGQTKEVCFSIDDLPIVAYGINDTVFQAGVFDKLVNALHTNRIPAIGFINERKLYDTNGIAPFQVGLLDRWLDHGLDLGNHTFSHPDFNNVSCKEYCEDILKGERITRGLLLRKGKTMRYFRHPFLHTGSTQSKADSLESFLSDHGYRSAPVTVDNDDYLFARAYQRARVELDSTFARKIGNDYISYMQEKLHYFERQAQALFGRNIRQILLIHASWLNADYLDSLAVMFRTNGYRFVAMDHALEDAAYRTPVTAYGKWGISWIDRWALSKGEGGLFFKGDPVVPEYIAR